RKYLLFGDAFERRFIQQGLNENRSIEQTLDIGWEVLSILPESELVQLKPEQIKKYHPKYRSQAQAS
ncbi:MAG: V-type ATP synthase subunit B, partial [Sulfolobales archaeon]|nr:V-type ATP synthase subunit B [Sulfolobales archaeon]